MLLRILLLAALAATATASDLAKEARWADQIVDALLDGEAVYLNDGDRDFLALETESADSEARGAAIVLHGTGVHPNWPTVVQPLRVRLTESGWHTLSLQMPVLANEAAHGDYAAIYGEVPGRIDAAVAHLRGKGFETIVLIGHSQGSTMAVHYLSRAPQGIAGLIAVGMSGGVAGGPMDTLAQLPEVKVPVLDLYGSEDLAEVLDSVAERAARAAQSGADFRQQRVAGADHFFDGEEDQLLAAVDAWLAERF